MFKQPDRRELVFAMDYDSTSVWVPNPGSGSGPLANLSVGGLPSS